MNEIIPFKSREVKHCPPHFIKVPVEIKPDGINALPYSLNNLNDHAEPRAKIRNWMHENVANRFFIGDNVDVKEGFLVEGFVVAFEVPADATYFSLKLPSFLD